MITADVQRDLRWQPWRWLAERFDYRACWSFPIHSETGKFVATLAIYSAYPREPTEHDLKLASFLTDTASIIVSRHKESEERRRAEAALRESEERLRQFGEASSDVLWIRDAATLRFEYISPAVEAIYGVPVGAVTRHNTLHRWLKRVHPADRKAVLANLRRLRRGERVVQEYRVVHPGGRVRWVRNTDFALLDASGRVQRVGGIGQDVTEASEARERQKLLMRELDHRVKNTLAVIEAIAAQTGQSTHDLPSFLATFEGRLRAMSAAHELLAGRGWSGVPLAELIRAALAAHAAESDRISVAADEVGLRSSATESLALALHELATNASKYGALSVPKGRVRLGGKLANGNLMLRWQEFGGPAIGAPPTRRGFGTSLLKEMLEYEHRGEVTLDWSRAGLICAIRLPLAEVAAIAPSLEGDGHAGQAQAS